MKRRAVYVLAPAAVAAAVGLYHAVRFVGQQPPGLPYAPLYTLSVALVPLALGRSLLALLPPGHVGSHRAGDLPETWAASHLLGLTLVWSLPLPGPAGIAVLAAAVLVRVLTLPGAMAPRHRPRLPAPDRGTLAALIGLGSVALAPLVLAHVRPQAETYMWSMYHGDGWMPLTALSSLSWLALAVLLERGLARAGRACTARALVVALGFAALLVPVGFAPRTAVVALGAGAAGVYLLDWRARADRRALWLVGLALVATESAGWTFVLVGAGALVLLGPPRRRRSSALVGAIAVLWTGWLGMERHYRVTDWNLLADSPFGVPELDPTPLALLTCLAPVAILLAGLALPRVNADSPASRS